ncbi:MAG: N-acetyltransferase family protein [Dissulfurispiraceae bacterium]
MSELLKELNLMRELNSFDSLKTEGCVRVSFRKMGFAFIDPNKKFTAMPGSTATSCDGTYLNLIYVRPEHRGKGIGEKILKIVQREYPKLWGIVGSDGGERLMRKCGVYFPPSLSR